MAGSSKGLTVAGLFSAHVFIDRVDQSNLLLFDAIIAGHGGKLIQMDSSSCLAESHSPVAFSIYYFFP